ncbi:carbohydrate ABC transporter membrane protein 1, CUT1 family [Pelagibacterium halotolerans]|uniref:carbohydrate ABC transporter permease n=1 Tax=Pelagibacterium halotolerans TaxID=531813 RepID=UPI000894978E|nr:sugar ABC transporter permease [Pelagibacterium halotolerans]SEA66383.1 carbohydrate ABC transporter membrane protein 1, CUT1 family [Pelagibacterium halotolerans]
MSRAPLTWAVPALLVVFVFHYGAVIAGGWYAFTDWDGFTEPDFVGLENFARIFSSSQALGALANTLKLTVAFVIGANAIGLVLAMALNKGLKSRFVLRSVFFAPVVMSPLAVAYIWQFVFEVQGPVNALLGTVGLESWQRVWLGDATFAIWAVWAVMVWQFSGLCMAFYLAGLQSIPEDLTEAAEIDGASSWRTFRRIVFPMLAPAATVSISLTTIFGLRVFDQIMALTRGGPGYATETLATQVYKQTFAFGNFGYGAAFALVLTALVLVVSALQLTILRRRERVLQ